MAASAVKARAPGASDRRRLVERHYRLYYGACSPASGRMSWLRRAARTVLRHRARAWAGGLNKRQPPAPAVPTAAPFHRHVHPRTAAFRRAHHSGGFASVKYRATSLPSRLPPSIDDRRTSSQPASLSYDDAEPAFRLVDARERHRKAAPGTFTTRCYARRRCR